MSIHQLTPGEREELTALMRRIEAGEIAPRRLAVELLLARRLVGAVRRLLPSHLAITAPEVKAALDRIPLLTETPAWESLAAEHYEQQDLIR